MEVMILQRSKAFCSWFHLSSYSESGGEHKFGAKCGGLKMALLVKVSNSILLTTNIAVDPNTGVATNHIKTLWQQAKTKLL